MMLRFGLGLNEPRARFEKNAWVIFERVKQLQLRLLLRWIRKIDPAQVGYLHACVVVVRLFPLVSQLEARIGAFFKIANARTFFADFFV